MRKTKIITILSFVFVAITMMFCTSCNGNVSNDVKLNSLVGKNYNDTIIKNVSYSEHIEESVEIEDVVESIDYQYIVIDENEEVFTLSIILDNPNDYHIFDFKLKCTDENAMIYLDDDYYLLSSQKSINWKGATNTRYDINIKLTQSLEDVTIEIVNIYFSSRETSKNHSLANLNNKGIFNVFKMSNPIELTLLGINEKGYYVFNYKIVDERVNSFYLDIVKDYKILEEENILLVDRYNFYVKYTLEFNDVLKVNKNDYVDLNLKSYKNDYWSVGEISIYPSVYISFEFNKIANENTIYNVKMLSIEDNKVIKSVKSNGNKITICDNNDLTYTLKKVYFVVSFDGFEFEIRK